MQQGHQSPCPATGEPLRSNEQSGPWETTSAPRQENDDVHDLHNRCIDHLVLAQLGSFMVCLNSQDHGNQPLHHDRDVDDLQQRKSAVFCTLYHTAPVVAQKKRVNNGPADNRREYIARRKVQEKPAMLMPLPESTMSAASRHITVPSDSYPP